MTREKTLQTSYIDLRNFYAAAIARQSAHRIYCLADHAGIPGLYRQLMRSNVKSWSLFEGSREENAREVAPLLFILDDEGKKSSSQLLKWIAEHGTFTSSVMFLRSSLEAQDLALRLTMRIQGRISENMDVMLRFFDCRVFESLMKVLTDHEQRVFLGVADCWWYVDRHGRLLEQGSEFQQKDDFVPPLHITASQEFALLDLSEPDQVAAQLHQLIPAPYLALGAARRVCFLERHIAAAKDSGVSATHELALYCGLALIHGQDFALSAAWQDRLARVRAGTSSLTEAAAVDEND